MSAGSVEVKVGAETRDFDRGMGSVESRLGKFSGVVGKLALAGAAGFATAAALAIRAAGNFEQSLNVFQSVSNATGAEMKQVSSLAKKLGSDLTLPATSAKDAAEAMTELAKGGLDVKQSMAAAKGVLQLSAAASIEVGEAATITARALGMFGLSGREAGRVADVLANAANASTGEIGDFALGLQQSGAVAKQWGLSINETTAALMEMADAGIVGSDAGTSLKTMLQSLIPTSKPAAAAMRDLGVDVFNAKGEFIGIQPTIAQFQKGLQGMSQEQQAAALKVIFGSDAVRAANVILGKGSEAYKDYVDKTQKSGAAADLAAAKMKGFNGAVEGLKSQIETLAIQLGEKLLPAATSVVSGINNLLADVSAAKGFKAKIEVLWDFTLGVVDAIKRAIFGGMEEVAASDMSSPNFQQKFKDGLYQNMVDGIRSINWGQVAENIRDRAGQALVSALNQMNTWVARANWNAVGQAMVTGFGKAVAAVALFLSQVNWAGIVGGMVKLWVGAWKAYTSLLVGAVTAIGSAAVDGIVKGMGALAGKVSEKLNAVRQTIAGFVSGVYGNALAVGKAIIQGIGDGITGMMGWLLGKAGGIVSAVKDKLMFWESPPEAFGKKIGARLIGGLAEGISSTGKTAVEAAGKVVTAVKGEMLRLQSELDRIQARREAEDRAAAVRSAQAAVAAAVKEGKGVAEARRTLDRALEDIDIAANQKRLGRLNSHVESMLQAIDDKKARFQAAWGRLADAAIAAFDRTYSGMQTAAERELELIERTEAEKARVKELSAAQAQLAAATTDEERLAATERVEQAELAIRVAGLRDQNVAQRAALDEMLANKKTAFETALERLRANLEKEGATQKEAHARIMALYRAFGVDYGQAGANLGFSFVQGIQAQIPAAQAAAANLARAGTPNPGGNNYVLDPVTQQPVPQPPRTGVQPMAEGGIVRGGRGGVNALIGEKSWDEAVIPLKQGMRSQLLGRGGGPIHLTVVMPNYLGSRREAARELLAEFQRISSGGGALLSRTAGVTV